MSRDSDEVKSGDKVYYRRCFGGKEATFVGMAPNLRYQNDCVIEVGGMACPAAFEGLEKVSDRKQVEGKV